MTIINKLGAVKVTQTEGQRLRKPSAKHTGTASTLALILSACGSSSSDSGGAENTLLSITKDADNYSASSVTGLTLSDQSIARIDVDNASSNAYSIKLEADGTGTLEFDFADVNDVITLEENSSVTGFTTLKVTNGTLDATGADLSSIDRIEVASGIKLTLAQVKSVPTIVSNSDEGKVEIEVASVSEMAELNALISEGEVSIYGGTNPISYVAASEATISDEDISSKVEEVATSIGAVADAPVVDETTSDSGSDSATDTETSTDSGGSSDVTEDVVRFSVNSDTSGNFTVGNSNGNVTVTASGDNYIVTPTSGTAKELTQSDVTSFVVNYLTMNGTAEVLDGETITGTGNVAITSLEGDAAADLSNVSVSGTKTIAVGGDVTFTGNLGSGFTTTVASGATLTGDVSVLQGQTIDGAGTVAITDLDTDLDAVLSNITATTVTATFNDSKTFTGNLGTAAVTVASSKKLTAANSVVDGVTITGGSVDVTGDVTDDRDMTNISSTFDFTEADVAISSGKTLTVTAAQAAGETFSGAGTLVVEGSDGAQNITSATTATLSIDLGAGDDDIAVGDMANITIADSIDGGEGTSDDLTITADNDSTGAAFKDISGIETITILESGTATENAIMTLQYSSANTDALTVTATALDSSSANFHFYLAGTTSNVGGDLTIVGGDGADLIITGGGDDDITGDEGADVLMGGAGSDTINGGDGADVIAGYGRVEKLDITGADTSNVVLTLNGTDVTYASTATDSTAAAAAVTAINAANVGVVASVDSSDDVVLTYAYFKGTAGAVKTDTGNNAGNITVTTAGATDGDDTITTGDGIDTVVYTGGADSINLGVESSAAADTLLMLADAADAPDAFTNEDSGGSTVDVSTAVILTAGSTDKIDLSLSAGDFDDTTTITSTTSAITDATTLGTADKIVVYSGTYASGTFTSGAADDSEGVHDALLVYDNDVSGTSDFSMIVLLDVYPSDSFIGLSESAGVLTFS